MRLTLLLIILQSHIAFAQINAAQQKALNNYVDCMNGSADEVSSVVSRVIDYYPQIHQKQSWGAAKFVCPVQLEDYYLTKALSESKALGTTSSALNVSLKNLRAAAEKIDGVCKQLDTYHKLEDYKQDNYAKAEEWIQSLASLLMEYKGKQQELYNALQATHKKLNATPAAAYAKADLSMSKEMERERKFIELWRYNLAEDVHTGWIVEQLQKSIEETDAAVTAFSKTKPVLNYPASSSWPLFQEDLSLILDTKRSALDGYNNAAKKSDRHRNQAYLDLINYLNGALVPRYNSFIDFSQRDGYFGLRAYKVIPVFEIKKNVEVISVDESPFHDIVSSPIVVTNQKTSIPANVFTSLTAYVDFINETWRSAGHMRDVIRNFNSSTSSYKGLTSFERKGKLYYDNKDFEVPVSYFQKAVSESKNVATTYAKSLNEQGQVLINILDEMNRLSAALELEVNERRYEKDGLKHIYEIFDRYEVLFETWDDRKEKLYTDVAAVFNSYPVKEPTNSWNVSGKMLRSLATLDHDALFEAKTFYNGKSDGIINTEKIDVTLREVVSKEFESMKGIQKYGRNNGLCPYTPYEDIPQRSKNLSELVKQLKPAQENDFSYSHPYHNIVYTYNDVADLYNKFCSLAPVPLLKTIKEPELFGVNRKKRNQPIQSRNNENVVTSKEEPAKVVQQQNQTVVSESEAKNKNNLLVFRDTIYIEKRDTIYLSNDEDLHSMEGYASNNLIFLLDVSGSMAAPEKLPILKTAVLNMISMMREEDRLSIIIFSGKPKTLLKPSSFKQEEKIRAAIDALQSSGKTDGNAALELAYELADENYLRGGNNRIILATDGEFFVRDQIYDLTEKFSSNDIFLSVFNFGKNNTTSKNLEKLAKLGKGNYEFIAKENVELKLIKEAKAKKKH